MVSHDVNGWPEEMVRKRETMAGVVQYRESERLMGWEKKNKQKNKRATMKN